MAELVGAPQHSCPHLPSLVLLPPPLSACTRHGEGRAGHGRWGQADGTGQVRDEVTLSLCSSGTGSSGYAECRLRPKGRRWSVCFELFI